jgi:hypothetical protein
MINNNLIFGINIESKKNEIKNSLLKFFTKEEEKQLLSLSKLIDIEINNKITYKSLILLKVCIERIDLEISKNPNIKFYYKFKIFKKRLERILEKYDKNLEKNLDFIVDSFKNIIDNVNKKVVILAR